MDKVGLSVCLPIGRGSGQGRSVCLSVCKCSCLASFQSYSYSFSFHRYIELDNEQEFHVACARTHGSFLFSLFSLLLLFLARSCRVTLPTVTLSHPGSCDRRGAVRRRFRPGRCGDNAPPRAAAAVRAARLLLPRPEREQLREVRVISCHATSCHLVSLFVPFCWPLFRWAR